MDPLTDVIKLVHLLSTNEDGESCDILHHINQLRMQLIVNEEATAVCHKELIFNAVFAFMFDSRHAIAYLQKIGGPSLANANPLQIAEQLRSKTVVFCSQNEKQEESVVVLFLDAAFRMSVIVDETLKDCRKARERMSENKASSDKSRLVEKQTSFQPILEKNESEKDLQHGLDKALVSCVHFGKLMCSPNDLEMSMPCEQQAREMFAAFSMVVQMLFDRGSFNEAITMIKMSEIVFQLADNVLEVIIDLRVDIPLKFLPKIVQELAAEDPDLSMRVPFRMYWFLLYVRLERKINNSETLWRVKQHLDNANHYCADTVRLCHGGIYAFMAWMLYGLTLLDCKLYDKAKVVLEMKHMKTANLPSCNFRLQCLKACDEMYASSSNEELINEMNEEYLLYFSSVVEGEKPKEMTAWDTIYHDPAIREYSPRYIPDYKTISTKCLQRAGNNDVITVQSLVLALTAPFIDLSYQLAKPTKEERSDGVLLIYGGSVNEMLDVQSHLEVEVCHEVMPEVPDIDMMMAVPPKLLGLDATIDTSESSPGYTYLRKCAEYLPSFELLADSFPIALNKVATFVADQNFAKEYVIQSILIQGPAISTKLKRSNDTILSYDHVPAFWIKSWPDVAEEWRQRPRCYGWPSLSTIEKIIDEGVLLVSKCHQTSIRPLDEWRFSFTFAERTLVDTLSTSQRLAYLYAKLIYKAFLKSSSFLTSYHLKTSLLWLSEENSQAFWSMETMVTCVGTIFRWLKQEILNGRIRNYFIPSNNMISDAEPQDVTETKLKAVAALLDELINNTFERILEADKKLVHIPLTKNLHLAELAKSALTAWTYPGAMLEICKRLLQFSTELNDKKMKQRQEICEKLKEAIDILETNSIAD